MDTDFAYAAFPQVDDAPACTLPTESGLEMLMRMPGLGFIADLCDGGGA